MDRPGKEITISLRWDGSTRSAQNIVTVVNNLFPDEENPAAHNMAYVRPAIVLNINNETLKLTTENIIVITKNSHVTMQSYDKNVY